MVKKASQISDLTKFSIYCYGGCYTFLDNLCFTLCYNNIMCKISDNTTIFSTSHWEKKIQSFYLGWESLSNNSQIQNVHQTSGWRFFDLRQTVICQGTYLILAIPLLKWSLVRAADIYLLEQQCSSDYHVLTDWKLLQLHLHLMTSNSLFCGFNYLNVYLYVLAVSCVQYDWWEELIELATNSADAGFPCGWRSNLGWVGMDTSH